MKITIYQYDGIQNDIVEAVDSVDRAIMRQAVRIKCRFDLNYDDYGQIVHEIKRIVTDNFNRTV